MKESTQILNLIEEYIKSTSQYSILINGGWGSGKTFFFENKLKRKINKLGYTTVYISLNGLNNIDDLRKLILGRLLIVTDQKKDKQNKISLKDSVIRSVGNAFKNTSISNFLAKSLNPIDLFELNNVVLCFDDLERITSKVSYEEVFGYINSIFQEATKIKCLFIGNEDEILKFRGESYSRIKEKIIGRSIRFSQPIFDVYDSLIKSYKNDNRFFEFLKSQKQRITEIFLLAENSNLRTFQIALENLYKVHNLIDEDLVGLETIHDDVILFTILITIDYKNGNLPTEFKGFHDVPYYGYKVGIKNADPYLKPSVGYEIFRFNEEGKPDYTTLFSPLTDFVKRYGVFPRIQFIYFRSIYFLIVNSYINPYQVKHELEYFIKYKILSNQLQHDEVAMRVLTSIYSSDEYFMKDINEVVAFLEAGKYDVFESYAIYMKLIGLIEEKVLFEITVEELKGTIVKNFEKIISSTKHLFEKLSIVDVRNTLGRFKYELPELSQKIEEIEGSFLKDDRSVFQKRVDSFVKYFGEDPEFVVDYLLSKIFERNNNVDLKLIFELIFEHLYFQDKLLNYMYTSHEYSNREKFNDIVLKRINEFNNEISMEIENDIIQGVKRPRFIKLQRCLEMLLLYFEDNVNEREIIPTLAEYKREIKKKTATNV